MIDPRLTNRKRDSPALGHAADHEGAAGENSRTSKLTTADVLELRKKYVAGASFDELAAEYDVARCSVQRIITGTGWKHLNLLNISRGREDVLTIETIHEIRKLYVDDSELTYEKIGEMFNRSAYAIGKIIVGKTPKHLRLPNLSRRRR